MPGRKVDTLVEPAFFHSGPYSLDEELVHSHSVGAVNDLTPGTLPRLPGDGNLAMVCIRKGYPYVGLCLTQEHAQALNPSSLI